jgi:hypothetical protein
MRARPRAAGALAKGAVAVGDHHLAAGFVDQASNVAVGIGQGKAGDLTAPVAS